MKPEFFSGEIFENFLNIKFRKNPSIGTWVLFHSYRRTDGRQTWRS